MYHNWLTRLIRAILPFAFVALLKGADPHFEPNIGQAAQDILFLSRVGTTAAYVEDRAVEFQIASAHAVRLSWVAASAAKSTSSNWVLSNPTGDTKFYCNQPNVDLCRQAVPSYAQLTRTALYPNLDWALHGSGPNLEYDLIVHPGGKLADAKFRIEGATARLDRDGTLHAGKILQWRPVAYQMIDGKKSP